MVVEQDIRFLPDVPLQEVSYTPLVYPRLFLQAKGNQHVRSLQARSATGEWAHYQALLAPSDLFLQQAEEVSVALSRRFRRENQPILRSRATVNGASLARSTFRIAFPRRAKEHATSCKPSFV